MLSQKLLKNTVYVAPFVLIPFVYGLISINNILVITIVMSFLILSFISTFLIKKKGESMVKNQEDILIMAVNDLNIAKYFMEKKSNMNIMFKKKEYVFEIIQLSETKSLFTYLFCLFTEILIAMLCLFFYQITIDTSNTETPTLLQTILMIISTIPFMVYYVYSNAINKKAYSLVESIINGV